MSFRLAFQGFFLGIVFTIITAVIVVIKVLERVEKKYQIRRASIEEQNRKFLEDVDKQKERLNAIKPEGVKEKEAELNIYGIPTNPPFDPSIAWVIEGKIHMQLGGKRSTKAMKHVYLTNNALYFCTKKGVSVDSFNIEGSLLKKAETETKLKAAIEVLNPRRPYLYPPRVDYFYLICKSEKEMERWFFALVACGCTQHPTGAVTQVPPALLEHDDSSESSCSDSVLGNYSGHLGAGCVSRYRHEVHRKGWIVVQKEESVRSLRRFAVIDGQELLLYDTEKVLSATADSISLNQCNITPSTQKRHKHAIELRRKDQEISPGVDFLTLIFETENDKDIWQLALTATIQGSTRGSPVVPRRGSDSSAFTADKFRPASAEHPKPSLVEAPVQLLPLSETRRKETVEWLNPLIARFWQNIRVNSSMKEALRTKLASKLMQKVTEKKLSGYLSNVTVEDVDLGESIPVLKSAKLLEPRVAGEVSLDLSIVFRGQMSARIRATVSLPMISAISFSAVASISHFEGTLNLNCPPFPAERFSISFYTEPKTEISVQTFIGDKDWLNQVPKVSELIIARLRLSIMERLVTPNRRYFRIPRSATSDELKTAYAAFLVASGVQPDAPPAPSPVAPVRLSVGSQSTPNTSTVAAPSSPPLPAPPPAIITAPPIASSSNNNNIATASASGLTLPPPPRQPSPDLRSSKRERIAAMLKRKSTSLSELTEAEATRVRKYFQRWYWRAMYKQQLRRKRLLVALRDQERSYVNMLRCAGELYGSPPFESFTRIAEVAALFAELFMVLSFHKQLNESLFERSLKWNVDSHVGDLLIDAATFIKEKETQYQLKLQHFMGVTLVDWSKNSPQRYATFKALRVGDQSIEEALAAPLQSIGRYLSWCEAMFLATAVMHNDRQLLDNAMRKFKVLADGVAPHKFRNTIKSFFAHK